MDNFDTLGKGLKEATSMIVESAKKEFNQSKAWFLTSVDAVPPGSMHWTPSPTARTPLQLVAHVALSVNHMLGNLAGNTFAVKTMLEADSFHREQELAINSLEKAKEELDNNTAAYFQWLDSLEFDDLHGEVEMPFGMGKVKVAEAISFMPKHIDWHHAQLQYLQTIYGDRTWI